MKHKGIFRLVSTLTDSLKEVESVLRLIYPFAHNKSFYYLPTNQSVTLHILYAIGIIIDNVLPNSLIADLRHRE